MAVVKNIHDSLHQCYENYKSLSTRDKVRWWTDFLLNNAIYIIIILLIIYVQYFSIREGFANRFISLPSMIDIINRASSSMFLALGVGGIIVLTGTDLSAGRIMGLMAVISASLLQNPVDIFPAKMWPNLDAPPILAVMLLVMVLGGIIGIFNGFFVSQFKLHPFIVTLSTMIMLNGIVLWYLQLGNNGGAPVAGLLPEYGNFVRGTVEIAGTRVPYFVFYAIIATAIMWFIWNKTKLGKNMYAVGANPEAANVSGVSVKATTIAIFAIGGVLYGFSGFVEAARVGSNSAATGFMAELDAIAACVIGGVSFTGGVGRIRGIVTGVILLQVISIALQWLGVSSDVRLIITGALILTAVALDMRKYRARK